MLTVGSGNEAQRREWVKRKLQDLPAGLRILDAGAGEQQFREFCAHLHYVSQDFGEYDPRKNASSLQMPSWDYGKLDYICDIASIPEADASFDAIMCTEVFEHLPDPLPALKEFSRLLKDGGTLILTAPFCSLTHFAPFHFSTGFNRYWYEHHLGAHQLEIIELKTNGSYFEYLAQELRRLPAITERYAKRSVGRLQKVVVRAVLSLLQRSANLDEGSHELLCYGYHVLARKRG
ncbi:MAG: methyltransferase protein [Bacteroidetes bacterium]|nr:methyltransferase protein [Bacteroidota bacterium]